MRTVFILSIVGILVFAGVYADSRIVSAESYEEPSYQSDNGVVIIGRTDRLKNESCSRCHDLVTNSEGRAGGAHPEVRMQHGELNKTCNNCHSADDVKMLVLMRGDAKLPFEESYRLCSQCHGNILKDWQAGVHGTQTGSWNGAKRRQTCTACHNPHNPPFQPMKPMPAPQHPHSR